MGVCGTVSGAVPGGRTAARALFAGCVQRSAVYREVGHAVADDAARSAPSRVVYHQTQRWIRAGCFETMVEDLRTLLRELAGRSARPTAMILDSRTVQSTPESGARAGYSGAKRRKGSKVHAAVDTLGHLLALHVTAADQQDRAQVERLAAEVQWITEQNVELAYVVQGYTGEAAAEAANKHGIHLQVVKHTEAEARLRAAAPKMGGRKKLPQGRTLPNTRQGLRTPLRHTRSIPLLRLRMDHARQNLHPAQPKLRTGSRLNEISGTQAFGAPRQPISSPSTKRNPCCNSAGLLSLMAVRRQASNPFTSQARQPYSSPSAMND